jgi:spore germination protein YaaH
VRYTLQNAPRSRIVLGIADYGMTWDAFGRAHRVTAASVYPRLGPDAAANQDGGQILEGGGKVTWVEQDRSLSLKLRVAENAKVAGVAMWIRGGESSNLWQAPLVAPPTASKGS